MHVNFGRGKWSEEQLGTCYSFRFTETPRFTQEDDCIRTAVNPQHREGFDNISLLTPEKFKKGVTITMHCSFEDLGCPEIILVPEKEVCEDGAVRYGACFEVIPWKCGLNVWRHYREEGLCFWHRRLGLEYPVAENTVHELIVQVQDQELIITLDDMKIFLHTEDLPEQFYVGLTGCEGVARIYDYTVE